MDLARPLMVALAAFAISTTPAAAQEEVERLIEDLEQGLVQEQVREGFQQPSWLTDLYTKLLANDQHRAIAYDALEGILAEGLHALSPLEPTGQGVCAYLAGTGGSVPRLDGGGDFLNPVGGLFSGPGPFPRASGDRIGGYHDTPYGGGSSLVIVDDFRAGELAVALQRLISLEHPFNPPHGPDRVWGATIGFLAALEGLPHEDAEIPHGHLVAYHALSQFPPDTHVADVRRPHGGRVDITLFHREHGHLNVHLLAIHFEKMDTIGNALSEASALSPAHVVLSWGLVPCDLATRFELFEADGSATLSIVDFTAAALLVSRASLEELAKRLCTEFVDAGLLTLPPDKGCDELELPELLGLALVVLFAEFDANARTAVDFLPGRGLVYFAAAGNQGLAIPMPPASWPEVVGVEACAVGVVGAQSIGRALFSNAGRIGSIGDWAIEAGGWFDTPIERSNGLGLGDWPFLGYWGTSFAAPTAALTRLDPMGRQPASNRFTRCN